MDDALRELQERGFIQQCTDSAKLEVKLKEGPVVLYAGFDPTGSSLHVGHMVPLIAMAHLQKAGHKPIALVGGGTARIGDPSGKTEMRKMLTVERINENAAALSKQIEQFLDFKEGQAILVDNADWLAGLNYIDFLRDIGRHFSVNRMLSFETYKTRLEIGLSFIEFNYQLLQSYDFLVLHKKYGCSLQIGGDDQWGNIVSGVDLVRRIEGNEVLGLTFPLVMRSDGKKMGKTEKGALYLDKSMTPPFEFFQYWRNVADADVEKLLLLYTFLPLDEIRRLGQLKDKEINYAKEVLAFELTKLIHGTEEAEKALQSAKSAFGSQTGEVAANEAIPSLYVSRAELAQGIMVTDLFARTSLSSSRGDARRLIQQGGARINDKKVASFEYVVHGDDLDGDEILLRAGKKRYFRITVK